MATKTSGTLATTTLTAIQWVPGYQGIDSTHATDFATLANGVYWDAGLPLGSTLGCGTPDNGGIGNKPSQILPGAVDASGWLTLPGGRGRVRLAPGDWIATDGFGNLFIIPVRALPATLSATVTTANSSPAVTSATNILTYGWQNGTYITGTNIPTGSVIGDITPTGLGFNLYASATGLKVNATGSGSVTATCGTFTHS